MNYARKHSLAGLNGKVRHHTVTRDGNIPHLRLVNKQLGIELDAPVKLWPPLQGESVPRPMLDGDGRMVFALPGGGCFAA